MIINNKRFNYSDPVKIDSVKPRCRVVDNYVTVLHGQEVVVEVWSTPEREADAGQALFGQHEQELYRLAKQFGRSDCYLDMADDDLVEL